MGEKRVKGRIRVGNGKRGRVLGEGKGAGLWVGNGGRVQGGN